MTLTPRVSVLGVIFHELRRKIPNETQEDFYARILQVMAQMGGGSANVL